MKLIEKVKVFYRRNEFTYYLCYPLRMAYNLFFFYLIPDKVAIERKFRKELGYKLDWNHLRTFPEKLQWLKLYDRQPWYSDCVDKLRVREYVTRQLGTDEYLIPLFFETTDWREVRSENMPDEPFVIKCNHDNSSYTIIRDKSQVDWKKLRIYYRRRLKGRNFFWSNREWPYRNVKPAVMVEKFLKNKEGNLPEYKFYCFSGKVKVIQLSILYPQGGKSFRYLNENYEPYDINYKIGEMKMLEEVPEIFMKEEMKRVVEALAKNFKYHIRVDIYQVDEKLYVGELTFFDGAGFDLIVPEKWCFELGSYLHLPIDKN